MADCVCHCTNWLTVAGWKAILVCCSIDHAVPAWDLKHLEATAIHILLASKPVKILVVYLLPFRPLFASDLSACLGGSVPTLIVGDLNAKHMGWSSRLIMTRGRLLHDYADENSCLIWGPSTPNTVPYNSSATPDVLDITKDLVTPVYLTMCSALSSDHFPILIDMRCRSSFFNPQTTWI